MTIEAEPYIVRPDYVHGLVEACQRFVGALLIVELVMGRTMLQHAVLLGALAHHALFHRCFGGAQCKYDAPRVDSCHACFGDRTFESLIRWATDYAHMFDAHHTWPPAVRAARLLQKTSATEWYVDDIARAVNVSAATLERGFRKVYGVSVHHYGSLVRLRGVALALRTDESSTEGVILEHGYRSIKDVYVPLRRMTGLTIAMVRRLTESQFASLIDGSLALPVPGCPHHELPKTA